MSPLRALVPCALLLGWACTAPAQGRDIRDQYGTRNLEAAKSVGQAIQLSQAKKHQDALAAAEAAVKADPQCQMALFWRAIILGDLGQIDESIAAYKECLADGVNRSPDVSANAAVNLAITLGKLTEYDESNLWFTRAILEDFANTGY
jgi:tetratricopeptide (TPR) repeat protein